MKKYLKWIIGVPVALLVLFFVVVFIAAIFTDTPKLKQQRATAEANLDSLVRRNEAEEAAVEKAKDDLLTAYVISERALKESLKDPDSYEEIKHDSYLLTPEPGSKKYIQVMLSYRAKNSFGGYVVNKRYFDFDKSLSMIGSFEGQ